MKSRTKRPRKPGNAGRGPDAPKHRAPSCRRCGCTDRDCEFCTDRTGRPCTWAEPDLCSACAGAPPGHVELFLVAACVGDVLRHRRAIAVVEGRLEAGVDAAANSDLLLSLQTTLSLAELYLLDALDAAAKVWPSLGLTRPQPPSHTPEAR